MTTANPSGATEPRRAERRIDGPFVSVDLPFEIARLRAEHAFVAEGHAGRTLAKYPDLRVVLETMNSGVRLPFHETAERMTLQVVVGQLRVWADHGENSDLSEGSFAAFDAARVHALECLHDCAFLLTLAWPPVGRRAGDHEDAADGTAI